MTQDPIDMRTPIEMYKQSKYRIKVVEFRNGTKDYYPQYRWPLLWLWLWLWFDIYTVYYTEAEARDCIRKHIGSKKTSKTIIEI